MKKKKYITPAFETILIDVEALLAGSLITNPNKQLNNYFNEEVDDDIMQL